MGFSTASLAIQTNQYDNIMIGATFLDTFITACSANINTEVGIIYKIPEVANMIAEASFDTAIKKHTYRVELDTRRENVDGFDIDVDYAVWIEIKDNKEYRYTTDPGTSGWRRFNEDVFSILPIVSQL